MRDGGLFRLERDGIQALREYVPGAVLVVGDRQVKSRGLQKRWIGREEVPAGQRLSWARTAEGALRIAHGATAFETIQAQSLKPRDAILVKGGFAAAEWDYPAYRFDVDYVGELSVSPEPNPGEGERLDLAPVRLDATYFEEGTLYALNNGEYDQGFAICRMCGYAESDRRSDELSASFRDHAPMTRSTRKDRCDYAEIGLWRNYALAAKQETNLLEICPASGEETWSMALAETIAIALATTGAELMSVDAREIGSLAVSHPNSATAMLYDNNPGGSGMFLDLCARGDTWFKKAYQRLYLDDGHHKRCEHGCIRCVLGFSTQFKVQARILDRPGAAEALRRAVSIP